MNCPTVKSAIVCVWIKQGGERFDVQSPDTENDVIIKLLQLVKSE